MQLRAFEGLDALGPALKEKCYFPEFDLFHQLKY